MFMSDDDSKDELIKENIQLRRQLRDRSNIFEISEKGQVLTLLLCLGQFDPI